VLIGLVMVAVVVFEATWAVVRHVDTLARGGAHPLIVGFVGPQRVAGCSSWGPG
jgi:hypothetical protein